MLTAPSEAVITPYKTFLALRGPSTSYESLTTLSEGYTIWCFHHPLLAPWASRTILIHYYIIHLTGMIFGKELQRMYWGLQRVWECIWWSSFSNAVARTLEGVEEFQRIWVRLWKGFRRSSECYRWGGKFFRTGDNCRRKGNEWHQNPSGDFKMAGSGLGVRRLRWRKKRGKKKNWKRKSYMYFQ